ncbi:hypothetical protein LTR08_000553 [Meristemomyces frigidus]|nr:hypothetical protein LTR08_000553 [Meristemomyces frigidus]
MAPQLVIDSHIHLWPEETTNEESHAWMTPGMPLLKPHLLRDYCDASERGGQSESVVVKGVVYVETDVCYDAPHGDLATWAKGPLDEILFLRRVMEGHYAKRDSSVLLGLVPWAPMDQPTAVLDEYLTLAKDMAGPQAWPRIKGFRFLLQSITDQTEFEKLVFSDAFIANLQLLGKRRFSFDIGVDQHSGGIWQLEGNAKAMKMAHRGVSDDEKVTFVINHLCKPNFSGGQEFERWCQAVSAMAKCSKSYMKLSGAFSELPRELKSTSEIAEHLKPWLTHVLACFGPSRIMFGSDWPVCNIGGPAGESSWTAWKDVVKLVLDDPAYSLSVNDRQRVWNGTAAEAYRLC